MDEKCKKKQNVRTHIILADTVLSDDEGMIGVSSNTRITTTITIKNKYSQFIQLSIAF